VNQGDQAAGEFAVGVTFPPDNVFAATVVPGLGGGQSVEAALGATVNRTGTYNFVIVIDLNMQVSETDEDNDLYTTYYTIVSAADSSTAATAVPLALDSVAHLEDQLFRAVTAEAVLGLDAGLNEPHGIAVGPDGRLYIADTNNHRIVILDQSGAVSQIIDNMSFNYPWSLDVGPDGTLYVADTWNYRIAVFDQGGNYLFSWGHGGDVEQDTSSDALYGPRDVKVGPDGLIYVTDTGNKRIRVYDAFGSWVRDYGSAGSDFGQLEEPSGLAFNPVDGEFYVAEMWNQRIQAFYPDMGQYWWFSVSLWPDPLTLNRPYLAVSPDGTLIYTADMDRGLIVAYDLSGQPVYEFTQLDSAYAGALPLWSPSGLDVDAQGRVVVVDAAQNAVFIFPKPDMPGLVPPAGPTAVPDAAIPTLVAVVDLDSSKTLNMRQNPGVDQQVILRLLGGWLQVQERTSGITGWIMARYVTISRDGAPFLLWDVPVIGS
jgi:DNA-binding beta-propeller fold protein YncE